jgi:hypothetical protein
MRERDSFNAIRKRYLAAHALIVPVARSIKHRHPANVTGRGHVHAYWQRSRPCVYLARCAAYIRAMHEAPVRDSECAWWKVRFDLD